MGTNEIRNSYGQVVAYIEDMFNGNKQIRDATTLKILGTYDCGSNVTWDENLKVVGYGNLLTSLIKFR